MLQHTLSVRRMTVSNGGRHTSGAFRPLAPLTSSLLGFLAIVSCSAEPASTRNEEPVKAAQAAPAEVMEEPAPESAGDNIATHIVEIRDFKFVPETITVKAGDRITWKNFDVVPHTATAIGKAWDSGNLGLDAEWSLIVKKSDGGDYLCLYHPVMQGRVIIED